MKTIVKTAIRTGGVSNSTYNTIPFEKKYENIETFLKDFSPTKTSKYLLKRVSEEFKKEKGKITFKPKDYIGNMVFYFYEEEFYKKSLEPCESWVEKQKIKKENENLIKKLGLKLIKENQFDTIINQYTDLCYSSLSDTEELQIWVSALRFWTDQTWCYTISIYDKKNDKTVMYEEDVSKETFETFKNELKNKKNE